MSKLIKTIFVWLSIFIISSTIGATLFLTSSGFLEYNAGNLNKININDVKTIPVNSTKSIEINSLSTDVEIIKTNSSEFKFELTGFYINNSYEDSPKLNLENNAGDIKVNIEYPKRKIVLGMARNKLNLKIFIPENYPKNFKIKTASGEIFGRNLNFDNLEVLTISGDIYLDNTTSSISKISSTSGNLNIYLLNSQNLELFTISGNIYLDNSTPNKVKTTSGNVYIKSVIERNLNLISVSGDFKITSLENSNFKVEFNSVSGDFKGQGNNDGECLIFVKTTSGDLEVN